jgi:hypothetical protein
VPGLTSRSAVDLPTAAFALLSGGASLAVLHLLRDGEYWNYSEGVYALTSRLFLHGDHLYQDVVVAQPPWQFLAGAAVLGVHDSLGFLRIGLGVAQLAAGLVAAAAVWRLTASRLATAVAPALCLFTPWAVHEHGTLTPEVLVTPVLLSAALLVTQRRWVAAGALLGAVAPFVKWQYIVAVPVLVAFSAEPRRALRWALGALAVQALTFTAVFGADLWKDTVVAQAHTGPPRDLGLLKGVWAQAAWNIVGLAALAVAAWVRRQDARDVRLLNMLVALAIADALTLLSVVKQGTGLAALIPLECTLVPLALAGAVWAVRGRGALAVAGVAVALAFTYAQTVSLLASAETTAPFVYPLGERGAWGREASGAEVQRLVAAARACGAGVPYSGAPFVAFIARRRMPGNQPDQFLPLNSSTLEDVGARMNAERRRCP